MQNTGISMSLKYPMQLGIDKNSLRLYFFIKYSSPFYIEIPPPAAAAPAAFSLYTAV